MYTAVEKARLYEQIVQQIERSIARGVLKPGDQLPAERDLAKQFGVSRTAIREAVRVLQEKGMVLAQAGKGTFVTDSSAHSPEQNIDLLGKIDLQEGLGYLIEVREIFEPGIAALAAQRAEEEHVVGMKEAYRTMEAAKEDPTAFCEADLDFHLVLAEATGNPIVLSLIDSIVRLLREQRMRIFEVKGGPERGQFHHKQILEAVEQRDPEAARQAMRAHLHQVRQDSAASIKPASVHATNTRTRLETR